MSLPPAIRRLFYRYHADRLDTDRHAAIIIPTVLADGSVEDWDWLFAVYGWDTIAAWIAQPAHRDLLPTPMASFWSLILLGRPETSSRWDGPRRAVPPNALVDWFPDPLR
jgi:hypothetical protein